MRLRTNEFPVELPKCAEAPCLSLYLPKHRHHPDNQQDPIRFRNLVKTLEQSLRQKYPAREVRPLLQPFNDLASDRYLWNHTQDGLAVLCAPDLFRIYKLQRSVRGAIQLFDGNRDAVDEIDLAPGVPRTIADALGDKLTEPHQTVRSLGGVAGSSIAMRPGHGGKSDGVAVDKEARSW